MKTALPLACTILALLLAHSANAATTYSYDALGRVIVVTYDNGKQIVYSYDAAGNRSQVVTQTGTNQPPVAVPDSAATNENTAVTIHPLVNDTDPDGDTLTIVSLSTPAHGTATITGSGTTVSYTPTTGYSGSDSFGYTISDGNNHVASASIALTMTNQPPHAVADSATAPLGTATQVFVLANDTDPENDPLVVTSVTAPSHGTAAINGGTVTYTTIGGNTSGDSFVYYIADNHGNAAHATVTISVSGSNTPPVAHDDYVYLNYTGLPVTPQTQFDPRTNDTDANSDPLTITAVTQGTLGNVAIINSGTAISYIYKTSVNRPVEATDTFTYTISDGNGGTSTATVTVYLDIESGA